MRNVQIVDGAQNCTYSLFAATNREFAAMFPADTDVAFPDEVWRRLGSRQATRIFNALWKRTIDKKLAKGIHGTMFFGLDFKKRWYPTRREKDMDGDSFSPSQRALLRS